MNTNKQSVFFADLHHPGGHHEEIEQLFSEIPRNTWRIFFLGDTFQFWINEKQFIEEQYTPFLSQLQSWAKKGIELFFIEGNRDFLASHYFDKTPWIDVITNPTITEMGGKVVYLGHGDELCWNDYAYQFYKTIIRSRPTRCLANHLPAKMRRSIADRMSNASGKIVAGKSEKTLHVPHRAYESMIMSGIELILHGHVHEFYQRDYTAGSFQGKVISFGWKDGKRNFLHFEG